MPAHTESQFLPYTPAQLFAMVADVARYPEFLPWCSAARILERGAMDVTEQGEARSGGVRGEDPRRTEYFLAELVISYMGFNESYTSRVTLTPPNEKGNGAIDVVMVKGPFSHLTNNWRFAPEDSGTRVDFALDFKFRSMMMEMMMGRFFTAATDKMIDAFRARAETLYGGH